jgi:peptidoglycan/xylan/chitin deacetylase (PgdA/CDA1 family)
MNLLREIFWRILRFFGWEYSSWKDLPPRMTVLLYHSISSADDFLAVPPAVFEEQMRYLRNNLQIVPLSRAFEHAAGTPVERDSVAITFDDGYRDFIENVQPILVRHGMPATVFVLSGTPDRAELGNDYPLIAATDIPRIDRTLIDIGSHGYTHKKLSKMPVEEVRRELEESYKAIAAAYGTAPAHLAYPKGSFNEETKRVAQETGHHGAVSVIQTGVHEGDDLFALPRVQVDKNMSQQIFAAKLTIAADWYYALWSLVRRRAR